MKCFYHRDMDGIASAAIIKLEYPDCEFFSIDYGEQIPKYPTPKETVFVVDFSFPPEEMFAMNRLFDLIWIDHHYTAIEKYEDYKEKNYEKGQIKGLRTTTKGFAGCGLTWKYIKHNLNFPYSVRLLNDYDIWNHSDCNTLPFQYGIRSTPNHPDNNFSELWSILLSDNTTTLIDKIIKQGDSILNFIHEENCQILKTCIQEIEFEGYKCLVANTFRGSSKTFDSVWCDAYDVMIVFQWRKTSFKVSLYSSKDEVDVGKICQKYGGGGHLHAAGFECKKLPFDIGM